MGEKQVAGARLGRPLRNAVNRQERFSMVRSVNVFAAATRNPAPRTRKRASPRKDAAKPRKTPEELSEARRRNLRKANRALKKVRAQAKT